MSDRDISSNVVTTAVAGVECYLCLELGATVRDTRESILTRFFHEECWAYVEKEREKVKRFLVRQKPRMDREYEEWVQRKEIGWGDPEDTFRKCRVCGKDFMALESSSEGLCLTCRTKVHLVTHPRVEGDPLYEATREIQGKSKGDLPRRTAL